MLTRELEAGGRTAILEPDLGSPIGPGLASRESQLHADRDRDNNRHRAERPSSAAKSGTANSSQSPYFTPAAAVTAISAPLVGVSSSVRPAPYWIREDDDLT